MQFGAVVGGRFAKRIELTCAPQVCRLLFHKLRGEIDPVELLEGEGQRDFRERLEALRKSRRRKRTEIREFVVDGRALSGELVVVLNHFAKQAGHKAQRKPAHHIEVRNHQLSRFRRVPGEMFRLEIARLHYNNSRMGLPLDWPGEKPMIAPRLGTRSMDCMGLS